MSKTNLPYMPLWVYDLEADEDCSVMSLEEFGAFMRLLQRQWIEGSIPTDVARIARLLRVTACEMEKIWLVLEPKFVQNGHGRLINHRLDEERCKAIDKVEKNRVAANKRWESKRNADAYADACPDGLPHASVSVSESGCKSSQRGVQGGGGGGPPPAETVFTTPLDTPAFRAKWAEWLDYRRERKLPALKPRSINAQLKELAQHGHDAAIAAIDLSIRNAWHGLFPNRKGPTGAAGDRQAPDVAAQRRRQRQADREHVEDLKL